MPPRLSLQHVYAGGAARVFSEVVHPQYSRCSSLDSVGLRSLH